MAKPYRPNVCIVITNPKKTHVLMFHRVGAEKFGWQFPQGGVDKGESENKAFYRELKEEIGTNDVELLQVSKNRVKYKFPKWLLKQWKQEGRKRKFKGQIQRWYLVTLNQGVESIAFNEDPPEFEAFEWVPVAKSVKRIIPFKRKAYKRGLQTVGLLKHKN